MVICSLSNPKLLEVSGNLLFDVGMIFTGNCLFSMKVVNIVEEPENQFEIKKDGRSKGI